MRDQDFEDSQDPLQRVLRAMSLALFEQPFDAIDLVKHIPSGGGLGGGSSDAGAVLRACDRLNPEPLGPHQLASKAANQRSDVPLKAGEAPACVQACPTGVLQFGRHEGIGFFRGDVVRFPGDMPARIAALSDSMGVRRPPS